MRQLLERLRRWFVEKQEINYLYFSIFFVILTTFSLSHFLFLEHPLLGIRLFFLLYAVFQAFLEVAAFILIAYVLKRWTPPWAFFSFIGLSFILLLIHFTDFTLLRLMDTSISYLFKFLFGRGFDHLFTAFLALNMNIGMIAIILIVPLVIPFLGVFLYWGTNRIAKLNPWSLSLNQIVMALIMTGGSLFFLELVTHPYLDKWIYNKHHKNLPLGATFLQPPSPCVQIPHPIALPRDENALRAQIPKLTALHKPNIYLFVIETLRKDFVNQETAPHLSAFAQNHLNIVESYANANWTPLSWFAIFHSDFPYHWASIRDSWKKGSIPLQFFKQLGYKICVYTSADLSYFDMDKAIFGEDLQLTDQLVDHFHGSDLQPCDRDTLCIQSFEKDVKARGEEGNLYIFFLDSTHSEYSFPKDYPIKFAPLAKQIDYLTLTQKEVEPVKNRYRNAIHFVDSLMGRFFHCLKEHNLHESAVVLITGDHGEEFYEEGAFFHGTHLNRYQTEVPIFCKFPGKTTPPTHATHIDLFPSLLHYITGAVDYALFCDGRSIFAESPWPYRIAVLQNASETPVEFSITKGEEKIQMRFLNSTDIYTQTSLEVTDLTIIHPIEGLSFDEILEQSFPGALTPLLTHP